MIGIACLSTNHSIESIGILRRETRQTISGKAGEGERGETIRLVAGRQATSGRRAFARNEEVQVDEWMEKSVATCCRRRRVDNR